MTETAWYWFYPLQLFEWYILEFCFVFFNFNSWPLVFPGAREDHSFLRKYFSSEQVHKGSVSIFFFLVLLISSAVILSQPNCSRTEPWKIMALWCLHAHWSHTVCLPTEINTPSEKVLAPFKIAPAKRSVHVGVLNDTSSPGYGAKWRTGS